MATENKTTQKAEDKELLKAIAGVLDEALSEYESLAKTMDIQMAEDPSKPFPAAAAAPAEDAEADADDEDKDEDEDEDKDEDEEMDDETLKSEFARISAEVEKRGLNKSAAKTEEKKDEPMQKTEAAKETPAAAAPAVVAEDKTESLRKSTDERFDALAKAIEGIKETVEKIASSPAPRKGLSGLAPLRKSEGGEDNSLNKAEVVEKLLELRKSGDRRIDTSLVNRVETNRMTVEDGALVKSILA